MKITSRKTAKAVKVKLTGEMTIYHAAEIKDPLLEKVSKAAKDIEMDLSKVKEIDSSGFQLLVLAAKEAEQAGKKLTVTAHSEATENLFGVYRMEGFFGAGTDAA